LYNEQEKYLHREHGEVTEIHRVLFFVFLSVLCATSV